MLRMQRCTKENPCFLGAGDPFRDGQASKVVSKGTAAQEEIREVVGRAL